MQEATNPTDLEDLSPTVPTLDFPRDDWSHRRHRLDAVLILFGGLLTKIVGWPSASVVEQLVAPSLIAGIVSLIGLYVFGALLDYRAYLTTKVGAVTGVR